MPETLYCMEKSPGLCIRPGSRCRWFDIQTCTCRLEDKKEDYRDAAEFEARVAAYIAFWSQIRPCPTRAGCKAQSILECAACWLKHARIAVEKEMERA